MYSVVVYCLNMINTLETTTSVIILLIFVMIFFLGFIFAFCKKFLSASRKTNNKNCLFLRPKKCFYITQFE